MKETAEVEKTAERQETGRKTAERLPGSFLGIRADCNFGCEVAKTPARRPALGAAEGYRRPRRQKTAERQETGRQKTAERRRPQNGCPGPFLGSGLIATSVAKLQRRRPGGRRWEQQKACRRLQNDRRLTAERQKTARVPNFRDPG